MASTTTNTKKKTPPSFVRQLLELIQGLVLKTLFFGLLLYLPNKTLWPQARHLLIITGIADFICGLFLSRVNPDLLQERMKFPIQEGQPLVDRILVVVMISVMVAWVLFLGWEHDPHNLLATSLWLQVWGWLLLAVSYVGIMWTFYSNTFAIPVVKFQASREHKVISTGPYAYVRHPMYSFAAFFLVGITLLVGSSLWGLVFAVLGELALAIRIPIEEKVLRDNLPGYEAYTKRVRCRLIPFIW